MTFVRSRKMPSVRADTDIRSGLRTSWTTTSSTGFGTHESREDTRSLSLGTNPIAPNREYDLSLVREDVLHRVSTSN